MRFSGGSGIWEEHKLKDIAILNPKSVLPEQFEYVDLESVVGTDLISHRTEYRESAPSRAQRLAEKGDLFYQTVRPYQKNNYLFDLPYDNYVFSTGYAQIRPKVDSYFLFSKLQEEKFVSKVLDRCTGTSYPAINSNDLAQIEVRIPKLREEQIEIGKLFRKIDKTIALYQQELITLKQTRQGFLQKMFPKEGEFEPEVRFPGFTEDWEERRLNTVFKEFIVPMRDKPKEFSGTVPWTRIEDIQGRFINGTTSGQYVSEETIKSMNLKIIPKGSLIVSSSATFGVVAIVNNNLITNQTFIGLVPNTKYNIDYLYAFFKSTDIQKKMKRESAGSIIFYIARKQFEEMLGKFPVLEEQEKIGLFFKRLDDTITLHQRELDALKETKKAFLQKLFV